MGTQQRIHITWDWGRHRNTWDGRPVQYEGSWIRVLNHLYVTSETGECRLTIQDWSSITGLSALDTSAFLDYINNNDIAVVEHTTNTILIRCRIIYNQYIKDNKLKELNKERVKRFRNKPVRVKTPANKRRLALLKDLRDNYHPARAKSQEKVQFKLYEAILKNSSKETSSIKDKEKLELQEHSKVLYYLNSLRNTKEWLNGGKYLPGLGKILQEKKWIKHGTGSIESSEKTTEEQELTTLFGE